MYYIHQDNHGRPDKFFNKRKTLKGAISLANQFKIKLYVSEYDKVTNTFKAWVYKNFNDRCVCVRTD